MCIYKCDRCHWIGSNPTLRYKDLCCPRCGGTEDLFVVHRNNAFSSDELEGLLNEFRKIPVEHGRIMDYFLDFTTGTSQKEIFNWFDRMYPEGLKALIGG